MPLCSSGQREARCFVRIRIRKRPTRRVPRCEVADQGSPHSGAGQRVQARRQSSACLSRATSIHTMWITSVLGNGLLRRLRNGCGTASGDSAVRHCVGRPKPDLHTMTTGIGGPRAGSLCTLRTPCASAGSRQRLCGTPQHQRKKAARRRPSCLLAGGLGFEREIQHVVLQALV